MQEGEKVLPIYKFGCQHTTLFPSASIYNRKICTGLVVHSCLGMCWDIWLFRCFRWSLGYIQASMPHYVCSCGRCVLHMRRIYAKEVLNQRPTSKHLRPKTGSGGCVSYINQGSLLLFLPSLEAMANTACIAHSRFPGERVVPLLCCTPSHSISFPARSEK